MKGGGQNAVTFLFTSTESGFNPCLGVLYVETYECGRCSYKGTSKRLFCEGCGAVIDRTALRSVRLAGAVGVRHASSPALDAFWETGDAEVFDDPRLKGRRNTPV